MTKTQLRSASVLHLAKAQGLKSSKQREPYVLKSRIWLLPKSRETYLSSPKTNLKTTKTQRICTRTPNSHKQLIPRPALSSNDLQQIRSRSRPPVGPILRVPLPDTSKGRAGASPSRVVDERLQSQVYDIASSRQC